MLCDELTWAAVAATITHEEICEVGAFYGGVEWYNTCTDPQYGNADRYPALKYNSNETFAQTSSTKATCSYNYTGTLFRVCACMDDVDGDGVADYLDTCIDADGDGYGVGVSCTGDDCDDGNASIYQNLTGYMDVDGDTYTVGGSVQVCSAESLPSPYVPSSAGDDCDDSDPDINPGAAEVCDSADNDCDSLTDEAGVEASCTSYPNTTAACNAGTCSYTCNTGYHNLDHNMSSNGCECYFTNDATPTYNCSN